MAIIDQLQRLKEKSPQIILFKESERKLSADDLYQHSSKLAAYLNSIGIQPESNISILLPRGIDATIAIYASLFLNCRYIPIDIQSPHDRKKFIISDARSSCVIGQGDCPDWLSDHNIHYINIQNELPIQEQTVRLTPDQDENIAAILYTSGSTGTPKGVAISSLAVLAFCNWAMHTFTIDSNDRIANLAPNHFDLSLFDLFAGPLTGATTVFMPDALKLSPAKLTDWLIENKITSWYTVPSMLSFWLLKGGLIEKNLCSLRQILFAGEVFHSSKLLELMKLLPTTNFYNLFGPTETNVCLYWPVYQDNIQPQKPIPIGISACDAKINISPEDGELLVKGPCLMQGYWNNGTLSLPLDEDGWFHTGDKISTNHLGEYEYHGRLDRMIKSAGYRIEPAEIETALNFVDDISAAAVIGITDPISGTRIMAAIQTNNIDRRSIQKAMAKKLPSYMQPCFYLFVEEMPILSNGKIDYQKITSMIQSTQSQ